MYFRCILSLLILLIVAPLPSAGTGETPEKLLHSARQKLKSGDYRAALVLIQELPPSGERDFVAGIAFFRLEQWEPAAKSLGDAAEHYPLLADYARYFQARALKQLKRPAAMAAPLESLLASHPDSPLHRPALFMLADTRYQQEAWTEAYATYQRFIAKYPSGSDALTAAYRSAQCRERLGEITAAVALLYRLWLTAPASSVADRAADDLKRLEAAGHTVPRSTADELYKRAITLFEQKRFEAAGKSLQAILQEGQTPEFSAKIQQKRGQILFRQKKYIEAEQTFNSLLPTPKGDNAETWYWLARTLDRLEKDREAVTTYRTMADRFPTSDLTDDALFQAAMLCGELGQNDEASRLLMRLAKEFPRSDRKVPALWELAWGAYTAGEFPTAITQFKQLLEADSFRDRALYWLAKAQAKAGAVSESQATAIRLLTDYPYGYYAQIWRKEQQLAEPKLPAVPANLPALLPWPGSFEREKALIACGLIEEARTELVRHRQKLPRGATAAGLARLCLEIEDYNGAFHLLKKRPRTLDKDPLLAWALSYPAAYRDAVQQQSSKHKLPPELVYAVMRTESSFSPAAVSPAGAIGLMQLMPATAALMGNGNGPEAADRLKVPERNISYGTRHLRDLLVGYKGDWIAAIAAYNAGSHNVDRWRKSFGHLPADEFIERIPFSETRDYVKKVLAAAGVYRQLYPVKESAGPAAAALGSYSSLNED